MGTTLLNASSRNQDSILELGTNAKITIGADAYILRLICLWLFLMCFEYKYISPMLNWRLGITITPDRIAFAWLVWAYLKRTSSRTSDVVTSRRLGWSLILFSAVCTTSWFLSGSDADGSKFRWLTSLMNFSYEPLVAFFIARRLRYTKRMLHELLLFFALLGAYLAFTAVGEHRHWDNWVFPRYIMDRSLGIQFGRSRGPLLTSDQNGALLLVSFLSLMCLASYMTGFKRTLAFCGSIFMIPAIYFTQTRSVWLGFAAICVLLTVLRTTMRRPMVKIVSFVTFMFFAGVATKFSISEDTLFSRRQNTVDYRWVNYETTLNMFKRNSLFGIGYGKFKEVWSDYFTTADALIIRDLTDGNHSTVLGILAELGIVGLLPYLTVLLFATRVCTTSWSTLKGESSEFERRIVVIAMGALSTYFILGLTVDLRWDQTLDVIVFLLLGIISSLQSNAASSDVLPSAGPLSFQKYPASRFAISSGNRFSTTHP